MQVEFFFDCSSPWTYLAFEEVQKVASECEVEIVWKPILVGGIFNAVNKSVYSIRESWMTEGGPKYKYLQKDIDDWVRLTGVPLVQAKTIFPINSAKAMRACMVVDPDGLLVPFARAVFEAYWRDDRDIGDDGVLADLCEQVGADPSDVLAEIGRPEVKAALRANTDEAIARGAFGSPTYYLEHEDMYFGVDRLHMLRAAIARRRAPAAA